MGEISGAIFMNYSIQSKKYRNVKKCKKKQWKMGRNGELTAVWGVALNLLGWNQDITGHDMLPVMTWCQSCRAASHVILPVKTCCQSCQAASHVILPVVTSCQSCHSASHVILPLSVFSPSSLLLVLSRDAATPWERVSVRPSVHPSVDWLVGWSVRWSVSLSLVGLRGASYAVYTACLSP